MTQTAAKTRTLSTADLPAAFRPRPHCVHTRGCGSPTCRHCSPVVVRA